MHNFDEQINRTGTHCVKVDMLNEVYGASDLLSMWVADSDFKCPEVVINRLMKRAKHGIFGYTVSDDSFHTALINWIQTRHQFTLKKEWIVTTPGVVAAINFAIQSFTKPGDKIIIQSPVYPPFFNSVTNNNRILIENPLIEKDKSYEMDFDHLETLIDNDTKMLILCNPHNPIGRVWTKEELIRLGDICTRKDILVISDEIHSDLILEGSKHTPFASLSDDLLNRTITCYAPSKTFNVAGLETAVAVIPNPVLREKYTDFRKCIGVESNTVFGIKAFTACYEDGAPWLEAQLHYIKENNDYIVNFLESHLPKFKAFELEGTYLLWLDCRGLNLDTNTLNKFFVEKVKVALNPGNLFGDAGKGFMRVNLATPRSNIKQFMHQLKDAYDAL